MNVRKSVFGKCCFWTMSGIRNIKKVISDWIEIGFLGKVIGEIGDDKAVGFGVLMPGSVCKETILLLHTACGEWNILEGGSGKKWTIMTFANDVLVKIIDALLGGIIISF